MKLQILATLLATLAAASARYLDVEIPMNHQSLYTSTLTCGRAEESMFCDDITVIDAAACAKVCKCSEEESYGTMAPSLVCEQAGLDCTNEDVEQWCLEEALCQCINRPPPN